MPLSAVRHLQNLDAVAVELPDDLQLIAPGTSKLFLDESPGLGSVTLAVVGVAGGYFARTMSKQPTTPNPVDQIRRSGEAAQRGDLDVATSIFAPEALWESSRNGVGTFEGAAAIRAFWGDWFGAYEELRFDFEELLEVGSGVVFSIIRQTVRPVGTTGYIRERDGLVWLWGDGLCVSVTVYPEAQIDEARAAAERLAERSG
jgi:hypothetical protein